LAIENFTATLGGDLLPIDRAIEVVPDKTSGHCALIIQAALILFQRTDTFDT
jgi:hypothetical protein